MEILHLGMIHHIERLLGVEGGNDQGFVINNGRICMGFKADRIETVQTLAYLIRFSEKCLIKKLLTSKC